MIRVNSEEVGAYSDVGADCNPPVLEVEAVADCNPPVFEVGADSPDLRNNSSAFFISPINILILFVVDPL